MNARSLALGLTLAALAPALALAQPTSQPDFSTYSEGDTWVLAGSDIPDRDPSVPAEFEIGVGPVWVGIPDLLVKAGNLTDFQQEHGALAAVETTCVVCEGPCDAPGLSNGQGWGSRIDPVHELTGGTPQQFLLPVYMDPVSTEQGPMPRPQDMTHYWCGNFLHGYADEFGSTLERHFPDYSSSLPLWARLGPGGVTTQSGVIPVK